jgi:hypothetical protein
MHHVIRSFASPRFAAVIAAAAVLGAMPATLLAQTAAPAAPPARETPRPQDVDPAVDTSRTPADGASPRSQDLPRPQDVNPGVDTSATTPSTTTPAAGTAAPKPADSATTPSGAAAKTPAGTPQPGGASRTQGKGKALDRLELDTTQITGNRELPKVLYIVPWKRSDLGDLVGKPVNSLLDEVLAPVDRDVFKRENRYYRALMPEGAGAAGTGATPSSGAPPSGSASAAPPAKDER